MQRELALDVLWRRRGDGGHDDGGLLAVVVVGGGGDGELETDVLVGGDGSSDQC